MIAGSGALPAMVARGARQKGLTVVALAHRGEADPALEREVDVFHWVRVGQIDRMQRLLRDASVKQAVFAGGIGRMRAIVEARPDFGALRILGQLKSFLDDGLLRAVAADFESRGIEIRSATEILPELLTPEGKIAGPALAASQKRDVALGMRVAGALGKVDVGQTVVVKGGLVLALEAVEGTNEALRRGAKLGGSGVVLVKRCKPGQDHRFDLPTAGPDTISVMREVRATVLALEAGRSLLLDLERTVRAADEAGISVVGVVPER